MIGEDRLDWLLGHDRPARVIPAGLALDPVGEVPEADHTPLHRLDPPEPAPLDHPHAVPGHENHILAYPRGRHHEYQHDPHHDHQILVSVSHPELMKDHLANSSIWIRAAQPGVIAANGEPEPLYLFNFVEKAVALVTGSSLEELWKKVADDDRPRDLRGVLGDGAADLVRRVAAEALAFRMGLLASAGVIDGEDIYALNPDSLIDALLTELRDEDDVDPDDGAIVTTLVRPAGVQHVHFSMKMKG